MSRSPLLTDSLHGSRGQTVDAAARAAEGTRSLFWCLQVPSGKLGLPVQNQDSKACGAVKCFFDGCLLFVSQTVVSTGALMRNVSSKKKCP